MTALKTPHATIQDRRQSRQLMILAGLVGVATIVAMVQFTPWRSSQSDMRDKDDVALASSSAAGPDSPESLSQTERANWQVTWPTSLRRDLFDWDVVAAPAPVQVVAVLSQGPGPEVIRQQARESLRLQGVMIDGQPMALINGQLWGVGSQVHGFEVCDIQPRGVTVQKQGVRVTLGL